MLTSTLSSNSIRPTSHTSENTIPLNDTAHSNTTTPPPPHIRIVPHLESSRSLVFGVIERDVRENNVIKIGRFTDRFLTPNRITFRSKVVSRGHAELWNEDGKLYIRDTRSSSGTFLNHMRLSAPNQESKPFQLKDGDIVQLGVDYQGGYEEIYRAVKMRIELNRTWQHQTSAYSVNTFQSLRNLITPTNNITVLDTVMDNKDNKEDTRIDDCCICLYALAPFQALFVAPCSHTFHFKCCRPLLQHYPGFACPICRQYADLDASVAVEAQEVQEMLKRADSSEQASS
ncbi:SMAD/FHA domain-containing protein [Lichtheimia hyalospora FSU 10163]|nr:SMAD/FHA domain-containing protein [Lichtheimia hyalospora FSU 10163]